MKISETKLAKLNVELTNANTCPVLKTHILKIFRNTEFSKEPETLGEMPKFLLELIEKEQALGLYNSLSPKFFSTHSISAHQQNDLIFNLESKAIYYCLFSTIPITLPEISAELTKIKKISIAAKKLQELLPPPDSDLFGLIKNVEVVESGNLNSDATEQFFAQIYTQLTALQNLKNFLSQSVFGQITKIGTKSPKGNINLRIWIITMYEIWVSLLGRDFNYDGRNGVGGPSRFIDFAFEALLPLHPSIEHSQIVHAVRAFRNQPDGTHVSLRPNTEVSSS